jgi:hypothetical protein
MLRYRSLAAEAICGAGASTAMRGLFDLEVERNGHRSVTSLALRQDAPETPTLARSVRAPRLPSSVAAFLQLHVDAGYACGDIALGEDSARGEDTFTVGIGHL